MLDIDSDHWAAARSRSSLEWHRSFSSRARAIRNVKSAEDALRYTVCFTWQRWLRLVTQWSTTENRGERKRWQAGSSILMKCVNAWPSIRTDIREIFVHSFRLIYRIDGEEIHAQQGTAQWYSLCGRARLLPSRLEHDIKRFSRLSRSFALPDNECQSQIEYHWGDGPRRHGTLLCGRKSR